MNTQSPNIVLTFADDQQANTINKLGNKHIETPNLDYLASEGTSFLNAHHFGSPHEAVCAPSRAMLHTGINYFNLPKWMTSFEKTELNKCNERIPSFTKSEIEKDIELIKEIPTLGNSLSNNGYHTYTSGKWHNDHISFNKSFMGGENIFFGGMSDHYKVPIQSYEPNGKYSKERIRIGEKFSTNLFLDAALNFLKSSSSDKPFFLYLPFTAPHDPRTPPPLYDNLYRKENIPIPENFLPKHPFDNGAYDVRDELLLPWPRTKEMVQGEIAAYYGMISHMDWAIGQLIETLQKKFLWENTIFVHSGDHGLAVGQHGLLGKQNLYEHSIKVPLVLSGPGIPKNNLIDALVYQHDLFPTLLEMTNISPPKNINFKSLLPLIKNETTNGYSSIFCSYTDSQRMIKNTQFKLIKYFKVDNKGTNTLQLFDLKNDPLERTNIAPLKKMSSVISKLENELLKAMKESNDPLFSLASANINPSGNE